MLFFTLDILFYFRLFSAPWVEASVFGQVLHPSTPLWGFPQQAGPDAKRRCVRIAMQTPKH